MTRGRQLLIAVVSWLFLSVPGVFVTADVFTCADADPEDGCKENSSGCTGEEAKWNGCALTCYTGGKAVGGFTCPEEP